jgi:uncharacterized membrane protein YphA (DoxX/SURF4 family)
LVLRVVPGITLLVQGVLCLAEPRTSTDMLCGLLAFVAGALLTVGLFTPVVASLVALSSAGLAILRIAPCATNLLDSRVAAVYAGAILVSVLLLGPGALSVDACVFGRREIIIPPSSSARR